MAFLNGFLEQEVFLSVLDFSRRAIVSVAQNDTGRKLRCKISGMDIPAGATARIWASKPGGIIYNYCEVSGNDVTVPLTNQMLAECTRIPAQIMIVYGDGRIIKTNQFSLDVKREVGHTGTESKSESTYLDKVLQEQEDKLDAAIAKIDINEIVQQVIAALPDASEGRY